MRSMTGYGRGEVDYNGAKFSVELNSVNRKQSDIVVNLPRDLVGQSWGGRYRGQTQKWFALRFEGEDSEIDIARPGGGKHKPEFSAWRWERLDVLPDLVIDFKRDVYSRVVEAFRDLAAP